MKVKIKICGLRRIEDIEAVNNFMPDYVGFVFAESKRKVTQEEVRELVTGLDTKIKKVGVFVNADINEVNRIAEFCSLDIVQLHGDETPEMCRRSIKPVWRALSVTDESIINEIEKYKDVCSAFVLDNGKGGTGTSFDWSLIKNISEKYTVFVAGGLSPANVNDAIDIIKPFGVDTSSGVETNGWKDSGKIKEFIENVRKVN